MTIAAINYLCLMRSAQSDGQWLGEAADKRNH